MLLGILGNQLHTHSQPEIKTAYLENHNAKVEQLLPDVELILSDPDILQEVVRQGVSTARGQGLTRHRRAYPHVAAIQLESDEDEDEEGHDDAIEFADDLPLLLRGPIDPAIINPDGSYFSRRGTVGVRSIEE